MTEEIDFVGSEYEVTFTISGISAGRFDYITFGNRRVNSYKSANGTYTTYILTNQNKIKFFNNIFFENELPVFINQKNYEKNFYSDILGVNIISCLF